MINIIYLIASCIIVFSISYIIGFNKGFTSAEDTIRKMEKYKKFEEATTNANKEN